MRRGDRPAHRRDPAATASRAGRCPPRPTNASTPRRRTVWPGPSSRRAGAFYGVDLSAVPGVGSAVLGTLDERNWAPARKSRAPSAGRKPSLPGSVSVPTTGSAAARCSKPKRAKSSAAWPPPCAAPRNPCPTASISSAHMAAAGKPGSAKPKGSPLPPRRAADGDKWWQVRGRAPQTGTHPLCHDDPPPLLTTKTRPLNKPRPPYPAASSISKNKPPNSASN